MTPEHEYSLLRTVQARICRFLACNESIDDHIDAMDDEPPAMVGEFDKTMESFEHDFRPLRENSPPPAGVFEV